MNEILYHGTKKHRIYSIMMQGFRLDSESWGRGWGNGVYLTNNKEYASHWGQMIVRCQLKEGCKILWHSEYDKSVVAYLKREFGKDIVKPDFWKVLPKNKQLRKHEIIAVWNYLIDIHYEGKRRFEKGLLYDFQKQYSRIYEHLKRHQFDGVGSRESDWPEILIFNPSLVLPISAHQRTRDYKDVSPPLSLGEIRKIQETALLEIQEEESLAEEYNQKREQLLRIGFGLEMVNSMGDVVVDQALRDFSEEIERYENREQLKRDIENWISFWVQEDDDE